MTKIIVLIFLFVTGSLIAATCETKREIYIENSRTKVWKTTICPNQRLPFHTHQFARVVIPKEDGALQVIYRSGTKKMIKLEKETPVFLSITQGKEPHQDLNIGNDPLEVTVIELRK